MRLKLIIGLGNPGQKYQNTYHNVGFLFIDYLTKNSPQLEIGNPPAGRAGWKLEIVKSDTYMNESGRFVVQKLKMEGVKPEELLIVHDDSDLELGEFKLAFGRGSAGHKGVQSTIDALKTKNFWRLRIGVRKSQGLKIKGQGLPRKKAADFVLKKIAKSDAAVLERVFNQAWAKISEF